MIRPDSSPTGHGFAVAFAIGLAVGVAMGNIAVGVAIGVVFAGGYEMRRRKMDKAE